MGVTMTQQRAAQKRPESRKRRAASESAHDHSAAPIQSDAPDLNLMAPQDIIALQRLVGNQAVMRMLAQRSAAKHTQKLPDQLEGALGKAFGADLSGVQIHTDASANQIARNANVDATSMGRAIY